jgi:hypothetical protein
VNYADRTLVSLADPATRSGAFDQTALEQILAAGYDVDALGVTGPFAAVFDDFRLAVSAEADAVLDGAFGPASGECPMEARLRLTGLPEQSPLRVDALWRGAIVARFREGGDPVTSVVTDWPSAGSVDAAVAAANGGVLPADPDALEAARRAQLLAELRATLDQPDALDDAALDAWLARTGATTVGDFLERVATSVELGTVTVTFAPPADLPETPKRLPIAAAVLVRDAGFSIADLLAETSLVRERMTRLGAVMPSGNGVTPARRLLVIWIVPASVFDDADWPGATADVRRANAGSWLADAGIGLAATA